ncbi:MAG: hypothetical protein JXA69_17810 [Phycisphaerae bacterium]|nr:hypothetical protein [Phycisphaerae bacterium]
MASGGTTTRKSHKKQRQHRELSASTKKALLAGGIGLVVLVGAVLAFDMLTAPPEPDLQMATAEEVSGFLGHRRGFARLSLEEREAFLGEVAQRCDTPERIQALSLALSHLSYEERQQFLDATFEITKDKFLKAAEQYTRTPKAQKRQFADHSLKQLQTLQQKLCGTPPVGGPPREGSLASAFQDHFPDKSEAWIKMVVARTTPAERALAKPFIDDMVERAERTQLNRREQVR